MASATAKRAIAIASAVATGIVLVNVSLWLVYRDARRGLEDELGRRLESVAAVLAQLLDGDTAEAARAAISGEAPAESSARMEAAHDSLRAVLRQVAEASELANVRLFDRDGVVFLEVVAVGRQAAPEALDAASVRAALAGAVVHGDPYASGDEMLMAGYAPLVAGDRIVAAVGVEADARFFAAVSRLRVAMIASAVASAVALILLGLAFARLQASLQRAQGAVQRAETLAAMGRMSAGIAHEIRNPLGIIKASAARLKKRYEDPQAPDERFDYIADEVDRLNAILTGYLEFARDDAQALSDTDWAAVVERSMRLAAPELEAARVRPDVVTPARCVVRGDAQRLQQVVLNLILNAVQAMPQGGDLQVRLTADDGTARLVIDDSGAGFPRQGRERLFEPFVTTRANGSGLGLAVARRIVEEHGGAIVLGDAPGGGGRVEVSLPAA